MGKIKRIGGLILVKTETTFVNEWEVYDEDREYQGIFIGNPGKVNEQDIWEQLLIKFG